MKNWNITDKNYPKNKTLVNLFEEQAKKTPDDVALIFNGDRLTYQILDKYSNQLAFAIKHHCLNGPSIKRDMFIAVLLERSMEMVIAMLGILKAGMAYVPIDPNYPDSRIEYLLNDSKPSLILTTSILVQQRSCLLNRTKNCLTLDNFNYNSVDCDVTSLPDHVQKIAYVIYTSGTTGQPKGVLHSEKRRINDFFWYWENFPYASGDVTLSKSPITTVDAIWEIFCPLLRGVPCVIVSHDELLNLTHFISILTQYKVSRFDMTPSLMDALLNICLQNKHPVLTHVKMIIITGETYEPNLPYKIRQMFPEASIINRYGSSEISSCIWYQFPNLASVSPYNMIGRPIANTRVYVVSNDKLVPAGMTGELYISAADLSPGYLNQPKLTQSNFIKNGYATPEEMAKGYERMYKTGDLACWDRNGNLEYRGRSDFQIKIRGFRIELDEIETVLRSHPAIQQATVLFITQSEQKCLVAYYVVKNSETIEPGILKNFLSSQLPDYMIPIFYKSIDRMPLTTTGKLNRQALANLKIDEVVTEAEYLAPRTQQEKMISTVFSRVLRRDRIGINDNFFELGGNSILAIQLVYELSTLFKRSINVSTIFKAHTVKEIAHQITALDNSYHYHFLTPFKHLDSEPLICFFPPAFGTLLQYEPLISRLNQYANIVSFDMSSHLNDEKKNNIKKLGIREVAELYIEELLHFNPAGPFVFIGFCFGGKIAHYAATLLRDRGITNVELILLDTTLYKLSKKELRHLALAKIRRFASLTTRQKTSYLMALLKHYMNKNKIERQITRLGRRLLVGYQAPIYSSATSLIPSFLMLFFFSSLR